MRLLKFAFFLFHILYIFNYSLYEASLVNAHLLSYVNTLSLQFFTYQHKLAYSWLLTSPFPSIQRHLA